MPTLIVTKGGSRSGERIALGTETSLGRAPGNTLQLEGAGISREHAVILQEGENFYLIDRGSGNGTLLNGVMATPKERTLLKPGDRITIETYHFKFVGPEGEAEGTEEEEVTDVDILEVKMIKKILDAVDRETLPSLEILNGIAAGKRFFLTDDMEEIVIGRDPESDFPVDEVVISRQHAKIARRWGGIALLDLDSRNGCFVNHKRIREEFLHDGDRIALGTIVLLFRNPKEINLHEISEAMARQRKPAKPAVKPEEPKETEPTETGEEVADLLKGIPTLQSASANVYPLTVAKEKKLSPLEIGLIGLGLAVFCFAAITLVNLLLLEK